MKDEALDWASLFRAKPFGQEPGLHNWTFALYCLPINNIIHDTVATHFVQESTIVHFGFVDGGSWHSRGGARHMGASKG
jgi:hypothetical protein